MNMDIEQISDIVKRVMKENNPSKDVSYVNACGVPIPRISDNGGDENETVEKDKKFFSTDNITLDMANRLIERVIKRAAEIGVSAVAAVVNSGARPVSIQCSDGSYIASFDIALGKAYTSVSLKMKTSRLKELARPGAPLYGVQHTNGGSIVIFGGGIPLKINDKIIGGFGVSGGSEEQDTYLGEYAAEVFDELISH